MMAHGKPVYRIAASPHAEWIKKKSAHGAPPTPAQEKKESGGRIDEIIRQCWSEIEAKCVKDVGEPTKPASKRSEWKAVRLFVSSTFHDYHSEREVLVKKVFPELREWCLQRQLHLVECDLRWGVPKDLTIAAVLCTCMDEIDRCHGDTDSQGMFLNMLGERYGWIPGISDFPADLSEQYRWVHNTSITSMEIMLGAYFRSNRNAAFFIRNPEGWLGRLPDGIQKQFIDQAELGRAQLKVLKERLREKFPNQCFNYSCVVDKPEKVTGRPVLKGLDDFGSQVLSFFKEAIAREYPAIEGGEEDKPESRENFVHHCTLEQKGARVFGREREYELILQYGQGEIAERAFANSWAKLTEGAVSGEDNTKIDGAGDSTVEESSKEGQDKKNIVAVFAEPGAGKSSLLAKCALEAGKMELDTFIHFVGCSGISTSHTNIMKRLCLFLLPDDDPRVQKVKENEKGGTLKTVLDELLEERRESGRKLLILIDDLSQLSKAKDYLTWLPQGGTAPNITIIITMVQGDAVVEEVRGHCPGRLTWVNLGHLTDGARRNIVTNYFKQYSKTLDPEQTNLVVGSEGAKNALWLNMACEELRVFGVFDLLTNYIRELPSSLEALLEKILTRLVEEDETDLVKQTLCLMECAREGLREQALPLLLGDLDAGEPVPMLHWAMVNRTLKPFLRVSSNYQQLVQLTFYHHAIGKAVRSQWLSEEERLVSIHQRLAEYFQNHCDDQYVLARETAYHQSAAKDGEKLLKFIRSDERSRYIDAITVSRYIKGYKCGRLINPMININGAQLFCCNFCGNFRQSFCKRQMFSNKDSCVLCGKLVTFREPDNYAHWCGHHPRPPFPFWGHMPVCHVCKKLVMTGKEIPLHLCRFCHFGMPKCCRTVID